MKLKKFNEFISINESDRHDIDLDEDSPIVLIDGEIYYLETFDVEVTWEYEPADPEVGIPHSYSYIDDYSIAGVERASLLIDQDLKREILNLFGEEDEVSKELAGLGFKTEVSDDMVFDLAFGYSDEYSDHWKQLDGQELRDLSRRLVELLKQKSLRVLSGANFEEVIKDRIDNFDEPEYDDY